MLARSISLHGIVPEARDLWPGAQEGRMNLLEEVSRLLNAYAKAILASGFWLSLLASIQLLLAGYQGRSPCL
jgi:hypothetical protein